MTETFKNFASRFEAHVSRFNAMSASSELPDPLVTFMLLTNANVDSGQRVSVLAAASPNDAAMREHRTTDE